MAAFDWLFRLPINQLDDEKIRVTDLLKQTLLGLAGALLLGLAIYAYLLGPNWLMAWCIAGYGVGLAGASFFVRRGRVHAATLFVSSMWIAILLTPHVWLGEPTVFIAGALLAIPLSGITFNARHVKQVTVFTIIGAMSVYGYFIGEAYSPVNRITASYGLIGTPIVALLLSLMIQGLTRGSLKLHAQVRDSDEALKRKNDMLAAEVNERRQAQVRQSSIMAVLESILKSSEELMATASLDELWRTTVEIGRERLGLERCGIYLYDAASHMFRGTYGTDLRGNTSSEYSNSWPVQDHALSMAALRQTGETARWLIDHDVTLYDWIDGVQVRRPLKVWVVCTPLRTNSGATMGLLLNDAALSGKAVDPVQQDLICVYASLVGNIAHRKQLEAHLQEVNAGLEGRVKERTEALADSELRFRSLVQHSNDIFAIIDSTGAMKYVNPAFAKLTGFDSDSILERSAQDFLHPEDAAKLIGMMSQSMDSPSSTEAVVPNVRLLRSDGNWTYIDVASVAFTPESGQFYVTAHDIAERRRAEAAITRQVALERTVSAVSAKFLSISGDSLDDGIQFALREVGEFVGADICRVFLESEDGLTISNTHEWARPGVASQQHLLQQMPVTSRRRWWRQALVNEGMLRVYDIASLRDVDPERYESLRGRDVSALVSVPVMVGNKAVGEISFDMLVAPRAWSDEELSVLQLCAGLVSNAIGRAAAIQSLREDRNLLEQRVAERTSVLTKVLDLSKDLTAITERDGLLTSILARLRDLVQYDSASINILHDDGDLHPIARYNDDPFRGPANWEYNAVLDLHLADALKFRMPVPIQDVHADSPYARSYRARQTRRLGSVPDSVKSVLYVPLVFRDKLIGLMAMSSKQTNYYTSQRSDLAYAFANYVAAAIENANVHSNSVRAAALEERSRLARELHDSVSQALFGIVLGTRTALHRIGEVPAEAEDPMKYVLSLAEAALSEMRALIFELRPESLQQQGLINAFRKQAEALCARHKIDVRVDLDAREPMLQLEIKEALYRVALEAIQNTIKHAHATRVDLTLRQGPDGVHLEVSDNGLGFDTSQEFSGHYGLHTMQERITRVAGQVTVSSRLGEGTVVRVWVPGDMPVKNPDEIVTLNDPEPVVLRI